MQFESWDLIVNEQSDTRLIGVKAVVLSALLLVIGVEANGLHGILALVE